MPLVRLHKAIASSGLASRRKAEDLITAGRVTVNGKTITDLGVKIDPERDSVEIDGKKVSDQVKKYILLNKPRGYLTTLRDEHGRKTMMDLLSGVDVLVKPVGRLDLDTEGLLLLTNDGELAFRLSHPRFGVEKKYRAVVMGKISDDDTRTLAAGVALEDGMTAPAETRVLDRSATESVVEISIHEGRKRQVRRMFDAIGHRVKKLTRVGYGGIEIGDLDPASHRELTDYEIRKLKSIVGL